MRRPFRNVTAFVFGVCFSCFAHPATSPPDELIALGRSLFSEPALSRDGKISCQSCHDRARAFADPKAQSVGVDGRRGTRNAPSLVDVSSRPSLFWDGRRSRLDAAVLDPLTNPAEMGWPSLSELREKLRTNVQAMRQFKTAFPQDKIWATDDQMSKALVAFLGTLKTGDSEFDKASAKREPLPPEAELGRRLFTGIAQCSQCHTIDESNSRFTDEKFHHSGIGNASQLEALPKLAFTVTQTHLNESQLGPKVLTDREWSLLGRFVVSLHPEDIGAFRTPSLRNVAVTAPYMHDGSIATLAEAVDHEVYYRGFSSGRPINLSDVERRALVAFLKTLTNSEYLAGPAK